VQALGLAPATTQFLLQPMRRSRAELIIGTTYEAPLGHFLLAGLGGIHAELIDSVILLPVPMPRDDISRHIAGSRLGALIVKFGTRPGADASVLDGVVDALMVLQSLVLSSNGLIRSIDVNPFLVHDTGCVAVDALIVPAARK
jgi:acetyltransferase